MKTLTYGTVPRFKAFAKAFYKVANVNGMYRIILSASDAHMHESCGFGDRSMAYDCESLYELIEALAAINDGHVSHGEPWTDEQMEWAGNYASSLLYTLGFEWV